VSNYVEFAYSEVDLDEITNYCKCNGSTRVIHKYCLLTWIKIRNIDECEICKHKFTIKKRLKVNTNYIVLIFTVLLWIIIFGLLIYHKYNHQVYFFMGILLYIICITFLNLIQKNSIYVVTDMDLLSIDELRND